jgi:hypothetical protein
MTMYLQDAELNFRGRQAANRKLLGFSRKEELEVEKGTATREGEPATGDQVVSGHSVQKVTAMTSTDACGFQRRGRHGKGGNWGKGYGRYGFQLQMKDISVSQIQEFPKTRCLHAPSALGRSSR